jgi:hypothetical protein
MHDLKKLQTAYPGVNLTILKDNTYITCYLASVVALIQLSPLPTADTLPWALGQPMHNAPWRAQPRDQIYMSFHLNWHQRACSSCLGDSVKLKVALLSSLETRA